MQLYHDQATNCIIATHKNQVYTPKLTETTKIPANNEHLQKQAQQGRFEETNIHINELDQTVPITYRDAVKIAQGKIQQPILVNPKWRSTNNGKNSPKPTSCSTTH